MTDLQVINHNGQLVVDSREVAEMVDKRHADLMRDIKNYCDILTNADLRSLNFFFESTYKDQKGEIRPCYLLTKKGCDMVANKMTGEKGVIFTAAYIDKFYEMEDKLKKPALDEDLEARMRIAELIKETDKETRPYILQLFRDYIPEEKKSLERVAHEVNSGTDIVTAFRKMVRDEIENQKTSFRAIAKAAEISHATIGFYLNGKRSPGIAGADQLLKALGLTLVLGKGGEEK